MPQSQNVGFQLLRLGLLNLAQKGGGLAMITIGGVRWGLDRTWNMEHRTPPRRGQPNFVGCPRVPLSPTRTQTPQGGVSGMRFEHPSPLLVQVEVQAQP